jgi:uncharacterized protein (DUF1800 family)
MPKIKTGTQRVPSTRQKHFVVAVIFLLFVPIYFASGATQKDRSMKQNSIRNEAQGRTIAAPTFVQPGRVELPKPSAARNLAPTAYDPQRLMAGHLLRRIGFGPTKKELKSAMKMGIANYVNQQLNPNSINDSKATSKLPRVPKDIFEDYDFLRGWFIRMVYSNRQLLEKTTLIWHEHFSVSNEKVGVGGFMHDHEELLRSHAFGSFKDMLIDITKDQAMLIWLDNNRNNGKAHDDMGNPIPPNENYAPLVPKC